LVSIHNTLRMIKVKPRQRTIAERTEIKDSDTLEQICSSLMKLSDSVVDSATTQDSPEGSQQRYSCFLNLIIKRFLGFQALLARFINEVFYFYVISSLMIMTLWYAYDKALLLLLFVKPNS